MEYAFNMPQSSKKDLKETGPILEISRAKDEKKCVLICVASGDEGKLSDSLYSYPMIRLQKLLTVIA